MNDNKNVYFYNDALREAEEIARTQLEKSSKTSDNRRVLIIVTGGTISMIPSNKGYTVKKNYMYTFLKEHPSFCDSSYTYFHSKDDFLITPETIFKKRIYYKLLEFEKIIDSSNMNIEIWLQIANCVENNYDDYDAFIILHGTDTMAYTSSALSFIFENLGKTVIITGSQVPLSLMRNDAYSNLLHALLIAGHFVIPEVLILFREKLFRGNRARKIDAQDLNGFDSPNFYPLAEFNSINYEIKWDLLLKPDPKAVFKVFKTLDNRIAVYKYHPLTSYKVIESIFKNTEIKAIIIESYGTGNLPINNPDILKLIKDTCDRGVIIVNISQCYRYNISSVYETGSILLELGVVNGVDMTIEATLAKLAYLLGKKYEIEEIKKLIAINLRGELSLKNDEKFNVIDEGHFIQKIIEGITKNTNENNEILRDLVIPSLVFFCAKNGFIDILQKLKPVKIDFNCGDYDDRKPIHVACKENRLEIVKFLVNEKVNLNSIDKFGNSALFEAIKNKNEEICEILKENKAIMKGNFEELLEILFKSVKENDIDMLKYLYKYGLIDFKEYKNYDGRTIGHFAGFLKQEKILDFLEEIKFDFEIKDRWGKTISDEINETNEKLI